jgi:hypothetical protein
MKEVLPNLGPQDEDIDCDKFDHLFWTLFIEILKM